MTEDKIKKGLELKAKISKLTDFLYAVNKDTIGNIGHTGDCKIKIAKHKFSLWSRTNRNEAEISVPYEIVCEIGEIAKREITKLKAEFDAL